MPQHFVGLNCTNRGAKLDIYDDMERFACGYCGTEMVVQRRGGTVSLKGVIDALKRVQVGTDKAAAELALVRLNDELKALIEQSAESQAGADTKRGYSALAAGAAGLLGFGFLTAGLQDSAPALVLGVLLLGGSAAWLAKAWSSGRPESLAALGRQIEDTKRRIEEQRRIVDSEG